MNPLKQTHSHSGYVIINDAKARPQMTELKTESKSLLRRPVRRGKTTQPRRPSRRAKQGAPKLPPVIDSVLQCHHVFRFTNSTTAVTSLTLISGTNLAGACGGTITISTTTAQAWASSIKIHKITVWPAVVGATLSSPEIIWYSPQVTVEKDSSKVVSVPNGVTSTEPLVFRPPRDTLCGDWFRPDQVTSNAVFGLSNLPIGSILDLDLTFTMVNNLPAVTFPTTSTGVGNIGWLPLDGSGGKLKVVALVPLA